MLRLNASAHSAVGNVGDAVGDNRGLIDARDGCDNRGDPTKTVQILREKHACNNAVIALGILNLQSIL